ncbi:hypothetical protein GCM10020370_35140 [Paenibacillus hodogayensis]
MERFTVTDNSRRAASPLEVGVEERISGEEKEKHNFERLVEAVGVVCAYRVQGITRITRHVGGYA